MNEVCIPDRFYGDTIKVSLFERVTCKSSRMMTKKEIINSPDEKEPEMEEIPIRDFVILGARYSNSLEKIRSTADKKERDRMKCDLLPAATISATLKTRDHNVELDKRIKEYNGIICLDFDNVANVDDAKFDISMLPWVWYCGLSCSGRGLYALVPTDNRDITKHKLYYAALSKEMEKLGLTVDKQCSDITRLRFVSFDVHGYFNEGCELYHLPEGFTIEEPVRQRQFTPQPVMHDVDDKIGEYMREWQYVGVVIDDYSDWLMLCMSLSTLGESGWMILEGMSCSSCHYDERNNRKIFDYFLTHNRQITIATFFYVCHKYGVRPQRYKAPEYDISDIREIEIAQHTQIPSEFFPEDLSDENVDHVVEILGEAKEEVPAFPVEVFPDGVREIIEKAHEAMNFPLDYIGSSLIVAAGAAIGNSIQVQVMGNWIEKPVIYMAIVGEPGTNKSAPLEFAVLPLEELDDKEMVKYNKLWDEYEEECKKANYSKGILPNPPDYRQTVLNDFTMEALMQQHQVNTRGMLVYKDELINFIRNMGRYSSGNDEMTWTSMFNGSSIQNTRKDKRKTKLKRSCVSICGTIQPGSLSEFSKGRTENGFVDRWLFAYPKTPQSPKFRRGRPMPELQEEWNKIMSNILNVEYKEDNKPIILNEEAEVKFEQWYNDLAVRKDNEGVVFKRAATKMEKYAIRLSIVLEAMRAGCDKKSVKEISGWAMQGAISLVDYYLSCGMKARRSFKVDPLSNLSILQKRIYNDLPISFTTKEGIAIAAAHGMSERTFKEWLHSVYFIHTTHGKYERRYK